MEYFAGDSDIIWGMAYLLSLIVLFYLVYNIIYENFRDECGH